MYDNNCFYDLIDYLLFLFVVILPEYISISKRRFKNMLQR